MTSYGEVKTMKRKVLLIPHLCVFIRKKISSRTLVIPRTWIRDKVYSTYIDRPRGEWDKVAELMMIKFGESGHPVFRATSPLSRGTLKCKGGGKLSNLFCPDGDTIETVFRAIISFNKLSIYGAVSDLCEARKVQRTSAKAFTTRSIDKDLYCCRIPDNS